MTLLPLALGVRPTSGAEKAGSSKLKSNIEKAHDRDGFACRYCGFKSQQFQRIIPDNEAGDLPLATVCTFCEQVLSLERAGVTGSGLMVWLPEITQADLNNLVRAIYVARAEKGPMEALATRALDALTARRAEAKKRLGSDDPLLLATIMRESLTKDEIKNAATKMEGIRLLPSEKYIMRGSKGDTNQLPQMAKYWLSASGPYGQWPTNSWKETLKKAMATAGNA